MCSNALIGKKASHHKSQHHCRDCTNVDQRCDCRTKTCKQRDPNLDPGYKRYCEKQDISHNTGHYGPVDLLFVIGPDLKVKRVADHVHAPCGNPNETDRVAAPVPRVAAAIAAICKIWVMQGLAR